MSAVVQTPKRVIIDTDPGVDDVFAILAALAAGSSMLEVLLISATHGNVDVDNCLRNLVTLFGVIEKENSWRKSVGKPKKFQLEPASKPIVALGAEGPIAAIRTLADYYHGRDGLGGTHSTHPQFTPLSTWKDIFEKGKDPLELGLPGNFSPSPLPAHKEMLRILRENPRDTITIVAVGPLTNLALAASEDCDTFLRAKEVVVMGGAIHVPGNVTPVAEFNTYADPHAAELIFSLTSRNSLSEKTARWSIDMSKTPLIVRLFPLDLTEPHMLRKSQILPVVRSLSSQGSPLAQWLEAILGHTYERVAAMSADQSEATDLGLSMHDPLCIWYVLGLCNQEPGWKFSTASPEDIRVETEGKWTRGMCMVDERNRKKENGPVAGDRDGWLNSLEANQVWRIAETPGIDVFPRWIMGRIFSVE